MKIHWLILHNTKKKKKSLLLIWLWMSPEKSVKYWEAVKFTEVDTSFPESLFLLESWNSLSSHK